MTDFFARWANRNIDTDDELGECIRDAMREGVSLELPRDIYGRAYRMFVSDASDIDWEDGEARRGLIRSKRQFLAHVSENSDLDDAEEFDVGAHAAPIVVEQEPRRVKHRASASFGQGLPDSENATPNELHLLALVKMLQRELVQLKRGES